jgi:hypothetical protein
MSGEEKNIDTYINEQISLSLNAMPSQTFEQELLKRISIENEFRKQDVKTDKLAKSFIGTIVVSFIFLLTLAGFLLKKNSGESGGYLVNAVDMFTGIIETVSLQLTSILGFSLGPQSAAIVLILLVSIFLYSMADKFVFRKTTGK